MEQNNQRSNLLIKVLGSAALAGFVAIVALVWSFYSSRSANLAMEKQLANQATQIARQDTQIGLMADSYHLQSEQATNEARKVSVENQRLTPFPTNDTNFAPTATALAIQSMQIEATAQAIEARQQQIQATQTAIAQPLLALSAQTPNTNSCPPTYGFGYAVSDGYFKPSMTLSGPATLHPLNGTIELAKMLGFDPIPRWGINIPAGQTVTIPESVTLLNGEINTPEGFFENYKSDSDISIVQQRWLTFCS